MPASRSCLIREVWRGLWVNSRWIGHFLEKEKEKGKKRGKLRVFLASGSESNFNKYGTELSSCIKAFVTNFICDLSAVTPHELAAKGKAPPYLGHKCTVCQHIAQYEGTRSQSGEGDRKTMKKLNRGKDQEEDLDTTRKGGRGKEMHANTQGKGIRFLPSDASKIEWQNSSLLFLLYPSFIIRSHQS